MSGFDNNTSSTRPQHHIHGDADPLPGTDRGANPVDYSAESMGESGRQSGGEHMHRRDQQPGENFDSDFGSSNVGTAPRTAFDSERPMGVQPSSAGGVAVGGRNDLPEGHATAMDKMIGKTEKVVGKMAKKPEMQERGELREAGGKAAATGQARVPHV
ncbi:hypothetical protein BDZ89DRAFT_1139860 [Hymenopellis radicata]|nr:hypothetical protein BDZ89DRAFT_1139860 [Hymenopellis radicata]